MKQCMRAWLLFGEEQPAEAGVPDAGEPNLDAEFAALIEGKYKEAYGKRVREVIRRRFKERTAHTPAEQPQLLTEEASGAGEKAAVGQPVSPEKTLPQDWKARLQWAAVVRQAQETAGEFPGFDLYAAMQQADFAHCIARGMHPTEAWMALHPQWQSETRQAAAEMRIREENAARPRENGSSLPAAVQGKNPATFTIADFHAVRDTFRRTGKRMRFD